MADITKVKVGVCSVTYNGVDLGHTEGGVEVIYTPQHYDVKVDKYGNTEGDKVLIGESLEAKVPLVEYSIANLKVAIPQSQFQGAGNATVHIGKSAGANARSVAAQLVLHPIAEGTKAFDIVFHKAYVSSVITLAHKVDAERVMECLFGALVDETKSDNNYLGFIGDSTL